MLSSQHRRENSSQISISSMQAMSRSLILSRVNPTRELSLFGPTLKTHWYQAETGYDLTHFSLDWEAETVTCPQGQTSSSWTPVQDAGKSLIKVKFSQSECSVCPARTSCTGTTRRTLTLHPREQMQALFAARKREETHEFKEAYRHRAGIEGTHSQAVRTMG
jgi:transposase